MPLPPTCHRSFKYCLEAIPPKDMVRWFGTSNLECADVSGANLGEASDEPCGVFVPDILPQSNSGLWTINPDDVVNFCDGGTYLRSCQDQPGTLDRSKQRSFSGLCQIQPPIARYGFCYAFMRLSLCCERPDMSAYIVIAGN